jgi:DNA-cytosine methyltransferase
MNFVELCAGIGGMRAGLHAAGWKCLQAIDYDADAVAVHRLAFGDAELMDVTKLSASDIVSAPVMVAGFPCQPFSTSGNRSGFGHESGNVFSHICTLIAAKRPKLVLLENVEGLLNNKGGHTIAVALEHLIALGYNVSWFVIDLSWLGVPQTRPRLFLIAMDASATTECRAIAAKGLLPFASESLSPALAVAVNRFSLTPRPLSSGLIGQIREQLQPAVGKASPARPGVFGNCGYTLGDIFHSFRYPIKSRLASAPLLGDIVTPSFRHRIHVRSGRYYARGAPTRLCLRHDALSHCVGTSLGGAPLFGVPIKYAKTKRDRDAFLEFANWNREQDGLMVMRLSPERSLMLFGPHAEDLTRALSEWTAGGTRKHRLVGNIVAPVVAKAVASLVAELL